MRASRLHYPKKEKPKYKFKIHLFKSRRRRPKAQPPHTDWLQSRLTTVDNANRTHSIINIFVLLLIDLRKKRFILICRKCDMTRPSARAGAHWIHSLAVEFVISNGSQVEICRWWSHRKMWSILWTRCAAKCMDGEAKPRSEHFVCEPSSGRNSMDWRRPEIFSHKIRAEWEATESRKERRSEAWTLNWNYDGDWDCYLPK